MKIPYSCPSEAYPQWVSFNETEICYSLFFILVCKPQFISMFISLFVRYCTSSGNSRLYIFTSDWICISVLPIKICVITAPNNSTCFYAVNLVLPPISTTVLNPIWWLKKLISLHGLVITSLLPFLQQNRRTNRHFDKKKKSLFLFVKGKGRQINILISSWYRVFYWKTSLELF